MFDHVTAERPNVLIICARNNFRAVATFQYNENGIRTNGVVLQAIANANGTQNGIGGAGATRWASTVRELTANIRSGLFELSYACNEQGGRLEAITGEQWAAICDNVRTTRVALAQANAGVVAAQEALRVAEQAKQAATAAAQQAQSVFESSL